jgi:Delta7-sterol 5-desaturase
VVSFQQWIRDFVGALAPLDWWLGGFVVVGIASGVLTGYFRARKIQPKGFKWRLIRHEIVWTAINIGAAAFTLGTINAFLVGHGYIHFSSKPADAWVIGLEYAIYFFGFDAYFYWCHRLMHAEPIYKWVHKTHHISTSTNPLTTTSINPLEALINGMFVPLYMMAATILAGLVPGFTPIHTASVALIAPTSIVMGFYVHSGFEFLPSWWNKSWVTKWFISATFHDQHHRYFRGNYGGYTTVWDRLCGTMRSSFEKDFEAVTTRPIRTPRNETKTEDEAQLHAA